jgi:hypothetical protein
MSAVKTLVVFYSRSGTTRRIAVALSDVLKCDLEEITEPKPRTGFLGYMRSLLEARRKRPSIIAPKKYDVSSYDLVVIGTPVWSLSSPVRAYLMATAGQLPEVAFSVPLAQRAVKAPLRKWPTLSTRRLAPFARSRSGKPYQEAMATDFQRLRRRWRKAVS